ncbi:Vacuolar protein sorting-associated protein 54 [Perkinsus olseni]|uniref:Vacuolar protein sorting-associated protein 54 n=2 Tax=Perkinsus olseni TaxID=32597 RepID=A0A7J6NFD8_PEROL|nr:Vacuolar protein sorting-associated protein 54 [Perkinsus olseni]
MHRVLMKSLSPKCVELIFSRVFVDFGSRFEARLLKEKDKVDDATVLESWRTSILADLGQMVVKLRPIADIRARMEASVKEMLSITDRILPPKDGEPPSGDILQLLDQAEDGPKSTSSSEEEAPADASTSPPAAAPAAAPAAGD